MSIYTATIEKMETQLIVWDAQIKLLEAKISNTGSDIKLQRAAELTELRAKHHEAKVKLKELKKSTSEAWDQVKGTADKIWDDINTAIEKAHSDTRR